MNVADFGEITFHYQLKISLMWYWNHLRIEWIVVTACWNANGSVFIGKPKVLTRAAINQDQEFRRKKALLF